MSVIYQTKDGEQEYDPETAEGYPQGDDEKTFKQALIEQFADDEGKKKAASDPDYADLLASHLLLMTNTETVFMRVANLDDPLDPPKLVLDALDRNYEYKEATQSDVNDILKSAKDYDDLKQQIEDYFKN